MKLIRDILFFLPGILFMLPAAGILVFQTHCSCTGHERISVYVSPETCEDEFHFHHTHHEGGEEVVTSSYECYECTAHADECGCNAPKVEFFKLEDQVVNEKVRIEKIHPVHLKIPEEIFPVTTFFSNKAPDTELRYIDPPPLKQTSSDFLVFINQLKIPGLA